MKTARNLIHHLLEDDRVRSQVIDGREVFSAVDLVALLEPVFTILPDTVAAGAARQPDGDFFAGLVPVLLDDDPAATVSALAAALETGWPLAEVGAALAYAAAVRVARFHPVLDLADLVVP